MVSLGQQKGWGFLTVLADLWCVAMGLCCAAINIAVAVAVAVAVWSPRR